MSRIFDTTNMLRLFAAVTAAAFILNCSGDSGTEPLDEGDDNPQTLNISLAVSSASPGDEVEIKGIPADTDLNGVYAEVSDAVTVASSPAATRAPQQSDGVFQAFVFRRPNGTPVVIAPLKPAEFINGGDVDIKLAGGNVTSNTVSLEVSSLPAAKMTVQDFVDQLQELTTNWLDAHGTSRQELRSMDPSTMPTAFIPLFVAQDILDSPDNPNSLRASVDGPVPHFNNELLDFDVTNRLLSMTDISSFLDEEIDSVDSLNTASSARVERTAHRPSGSGGVSTSPVACLPPGDYGINDAASLDAAMWKARFALNRLDGASGEVVSDVSMLVTALGVVPLLKPGAKIVSAGLFVYKSLNDAAGGVLPSSFDNSKTDFSFNGDKTVYNEDDTGGCRRWVHFFAGVD